MPFVAQIKFSFDLLADSRDIEEVGNVAVGEGDERKSGGSPSSAEIDGGGAVHHEVISEAPFERAIDENLGGSSHGA